MKVIYTYICLTMTIRVSLASQHTLTLNFNILLNDFTSKAYYDPILQQTILKIPRNYSISVDKYIFTLPSAIIIKQSETGVIDVVYENQTYTNIFPIQTNHIDFNVVKVNQQETYIRFTVPAPEVEIEATEVAVEKSTLFKNTLNFNQIGYFTSLERLLL